MKIISLQAENFKRLSVVEIKPDGNLVQITGKNASGKTSVLDAMWAALGGQSHIQSMPIRRGEDKASIRLDMGEIIVTRTFKRGEDGPTTTIKVENKEGFRPSSPQKMLDGLLGSLSFDPLAFTRMEPRQQFDALRRFVPDVDFDAIDKANKSDFTKRQDINREAKQTRAAAEQIAVPSGLPAEFIDEAALTDRLASAGEHNGDIEVRKERRTRATEQITTHRRAADEIEAGQPAEEKRIEDRANATIADLNKQIDGLRMQIKALDQRITETGAQTSIDIAEARRYAGINAANHRQEADRLQEKLDEAGPLPEAIDVAELQHSIAQARDINAGIRQRNQRDRHVERAEALEGQSQALTEAMDARNKAKTEAIAKGALPVPGLGFGDGIVTLNGIPFDQASDAEQLRASIAVAMASNPKLRVIRVRDGSLLDEDGMKLLAEMADAADCQVWVERVDSSGQVGFVLEDGHLKQPASDQGDLLTVAAE